MAVLWGMEQYKSSAYGVEFDVVLDHKALKRLEREKKHSRHFRVDCRNWSLEYYYSNFRLLIRHAVRWEWHIICQDTHPHMKDQSLNLNNYSMIGFQLT